MRGLTRPRILAAALAGALVIMGVGALTGLLPGHPASKYGKVLGLLTLDVPVTQNAAAFQSRVVGLRLLPTGSGTNWVSIPVPATSVTLPGQSVAPNSDRLFLAKVAIGQYRDAELMLSTAGGSPVKHFQRLVLRVGSSGLTPLLFTFRISSAGTTRSLTSEAAYGGNTEVNFGLQVAAGEILSLPSVPLTTQANRSVSLSKYRGEIVVLASFLTECQETCPLVAAALLQLQRLLDQKHLQSQVQIVEVTQDPQDDTPAILTKYQHYFSLPWPLLTGTSAAVDHFWSQLKVPPIQDRSWNGPAPIDMFTGRPEAYNIVHASVVDIVNPQGYVVAEMEGQPTLSTTSIPALIYRYLDQQGRQQQTAGGSWTSQSLLAAITPLLQQKGIYTTVRESGGVATVGELAPDFTLPSTAGGNVELEQLLGHPVLLDFWASWCSNCKADMKLVAETADRYRAQGLCVLLIDYQESGSTASRFLHQLGIGLPTLLDSQGSVANRYGVPGLPVAVFITSHGKIAAIQVGQLQQAEVNRDLPEILSQ